MTHLSDDVLQALAESGDRHEHVLACETCRTNIAAYRRLLARLSNLGDPEPPIGFADGVRRQIDGADAAWRAVPALLAAGLCTLVALLAMAPERPSVWSALRGFALAARVVRGALLSFGGAPLLATALVLLFAAFSIHRLVREEQT